MAHTQIARCKAINRTLGAYTAARYMALRGWSIEASLFVILGK